MQPIPRNILIGYNDLLKQRKVHLMLFADYRKWLLYFLDFRAKYSLPDTPSDQVRLFSDKLRSKNQTAGQVKQAEEAISLFFASRQRNEINPSLVVADAPAATQPVRQFEDKGCADHKPASPKTAPLMVCEPPGGFQSVPPVRSGSRYDEWRCLRKTDSPAWDKVIEELAAEIKTRHYSRKTLKHYADCGRKFQNYLKNKAPEELSSNEVKAYLTYLAVNEKVSSSTQNLAFNALLFLYRHVLKKDFGILKDVPRAKKSTYIPVVLSWQEVKAVLSHLRHPYKLVIALQYACGFRLFEGINLRVKDFNFDAGILTLRGKGGKSRTVPIPKRIASELKAQIEAVKTLHDKDLATEFSGVFLEDKLEKKYPRAAKDLVWQWFFPQENLTFVAATKERRRYHLHETRVQEALYEAVRKAKLTKRVTSHTFRHTYATHLLQAGYDIRTIQVLLGHADIRTTMIYLHCVPSRTIKEVASPIDLWPDSDEGENKVKPEMQRS